MKGNLEQGDFLMRHSVKPKGEDLESPDYPGISDKGVELAKVRAKELLDNLEKSKEGTVMFISGASELVRTKSTALAIGNEIKNIVQQEEMEDVMVITPQDFEGEDMKEADSHRKKIDQLVSQIQANPKKRIIVDIPLFMKEFSGAQGLLDKQEKLTEYTKAIMKASDGNGKEAFKEWLRDQGQFEGVQGPNPKQVAENQLAGIKRLREFAKKYIPERPLAVGSVGHSWHIDTAAIYLANNGEVNLPGWEKINGQIMGETRMVKIDEEKPGKPTLAYGDIKVPLE